ncbi:MAG: hypothetical protein SGBAC_008933 [Bacillariaceae sp.]
MMSNKFLVVFFLSLLNGSQAILRKNKDSSEVKHPPASAQEMKALMEERSRRRAQEATLEADGTDDDRRGDKMISRNGDIKMDGDEVELSFMITMEEFRDTVIGETEVMGDKFVFSGPMAMADDSTGTWESGEDEIGVATGSCVVCLAEPQWCCDFFFTFDKNGGAFFEFGTVASSGYVFEDEGRFWVTGAGGDFVMSHNGMGEMILDPFFNPVFYFKLNLRA